MKLKHYAGELAYLDTISGLVPCKVLNIMNLDPFSKNIRVKITANRKGYKKNETVEVKYRTVVPRKSVVTRQGKLMIIPNYIWSVRNLTQNKHPRDLYDKS